MPRLQTRVTVAQRTKAVARAMAQATAMKEAKRKAAEE